MKTIIISNAGGVENLTHKELPKPIIQNDEVLIKVKAISINPVDVKARKNEGVLDWIFGNERPITLGWDISGQIVEVGSDVQGFKLNDEAFGMINFIGNGKAYAEYVAVPFNQLALKPSNVSHEAAAASTLAALTAFQALVENGKIKKGSKVLIHGASGGVGHFAVQIAKEIGAYVIGTSSSKNTKFVLDLGADEHIDYEKESIIEKLTNIDFVLDTIGENVLTKSLEVMIDGGTIITLPSPEIPDELLEKAKSKNVNLSFMLVQSNGDDMNSIANLLDRGKLVPNIFKVFSFEDMNKAHLQVETNRTVGKVVVTL